MLQSAVPSCSNEGVTTSKGGRGAGTEETTTATMTVPLKGLLLLPGCVCSVPLLGALSDTAGDCVLTERDTRCSRNEQSLGLRVHSPAQTGPRRFPPRTAQSWDGAAARWDVGRGTRLWAECPLAAVVTRRPDDTLWLVTIRSLS